MRKIYIIVALLCFSFKTAYSHPHIFIDSSVEIVCSEKGVSNIVVEWEFDEMFSQSLITDYDLNKDGLFAESEIEELRKGAFVNLKNYEYFTHLQINKEKYPIEVVEKFYAYIDDNKVSYNFSIPCPTIFGKKDAEFCISFYDVTYFCDIAPIKKDCVFVENAEEISFVTTIRKNAEKAFYNGQIVPMEAVVNLREKDEK